MSSIDRYYNYLLEASGTSNFFYEGEEDDKTYSPSGMFTTSFSQTARSIDGGPGQDGGDEDDQESDPSSGDIPERVEQLWDYVEWWMSMLPQYQGAANTISRLMVQPNMSPQDWYDFFYELFGFGGGPGGGPGGGYG